MLVIFHLITIFGLFQMVTASCDKEFFFYETSEYGYRIWCTNIVEANKHLLREISAYNELLLSIKNSTLLNITSHLFESLNKIRELNIENSVVSFGNNEKPFENLERLSKIVFNNTEIKNVGTNIFSNAKNLEVLYLENNSIQQLPKNILNISTLEDLKFRHNRLTNISNIPFCDLNNIKKIDLQYNQIQELIESSFNCDSKNLDLLNYINLGNNLIYKISNPFLNLGELKYLNLEQNKLQNVSNVFQDLHKLKKINLSNNQLLNIQEKTFKNCIMLEEINLSRNRLENLGLGKLKYLKYLNLSFNKLPCKKLNAYLPHLEILLLNYNKLHGNPYVIFNEFVSLQILDLGGNKVTLDNNTFSNLTALITLNLNNNDLKELPSMVFNNMILLENLNLSENFLTSLDKIQIFAKLVNLKILNLSYNRLETLKYELFADLDNLNVLDIEGNRLKYIDYKSIITNMHSLNVINVKANLFSCSFLFEVITYFKRNGVNYTTNDKLYYDKQNVEGIYCTEYNTTGILMQTRMISSSSITIIVVLLCSLISVTIVLAYKYHYYVKRRFYVVDELELIEE